MDQVASMAISLLEYAIDHTIIIQDESESQDTIRDNIHAKHTQTPALHCGNGTDIMNVATLNPNSF